MELGPCSNIHRSLYFFFFMLGHRARISARSLGPPNSPQKPRALLNFSLSVGRCTAFGEVKYVPFPQMRLAWQLAPPSTFMAMPRASRRRCSHISWHCA